MLNILVDIPMVVRVAVGWLRPEDGLHRIGRIPNFSARAEHLGFHDAVVMNAYSNNWWRRPGVEPEWIATWERPYLEDLAQYEKEVCQSFISLFAWITFANGCIVCAM